MKLWQVTLIYQRYPSDECIVMGESEEDAIDSAKDAILLDNIGTLIKEDITGTAFEVYNNVFFIEEN